MPNPHPDSPAFETLARELLSQNLSVRFEARGSSMFPFIRDHEVVIVTPVIVSKLRKGDIVLTKGHSGFRVHRLVFVNHHEDSFITRGDCSQQDDPPVRSGQIFGVVLAKEVRLGNKIVRANLKGISGKLLQGAARGQYLAGKLLRKIGISKSATLLSAVLLVLFTATTFQAQVLVDTDPSTSTSGDLTGTGTKTLTFTHSTTATADRALLVGVSMNIANSTAAAVTGVTYGGVALTRVGAQNDSSNTRRIEQWYLLNPASGTNVSIVVSVNIPTATTIGVVAGATVFTDVDQTVPLGTFTSASGEQAGCVASSATGNYQCSSGLTEPSVVNGMVFDTLAVGYGAVTIETPQTTQWSVTSGTPVATEDVIGAASSRIGAPSVPVAEYFNNALALTSVGPSTVALTLTAAGTGTGGNTVYTGIITGGAGNAYVGDSVTVAGFTNGRDNGTFTCTASTATTITLNNANGVAQTHAGTATVTLAGVAVYTGTITGGSGNGYVGDSFVIAGFGNAANNGTFTATASTATTLTLNNTAEVAQTGTATATTNATFNWAEGAISLNPSVADIGVTTAVGSAVFAGQSSTYTITVFNNGTSAANTVKLSDALPAGMTLNSVTPSAGTTCVTTTNPITCTLPTPFASGATATIVVVETAATSGAYANTATVSDSNTPPDPNTGNNTYTAVATVQSAACANVGQAGPASSPLTGTVNSYYPGKASVTAGLKSITLGAATGGPGGTPVAIATGNLLLVIQMQDASITTSDTVTYGNGSTGQGFSALNNAGNFEYVTATNTVPITGGTLTLTGSGNGGGLVFGYDAAAATGTKGQSTFQVIVVPQYTTATLSATGLAAPAWNGSTGGVLALDTSSTLTLGGATVVMDGLGFRGGAGLQMSGIPTTAPPILPTSTDFVQWAPATYTAAGGTGNGQAGWDAPKGEGIAGTPAWLEENVSGTMEPVSTGTGYPSGAYGQFTITSVANGNGTTTTYTGTITGGGGNAWAGYTFVIGGFANAANNGRFTSTASTATTLTLSNTSGVAQTGTATANLDGSMARGAPANAGGGGTDADPANTTQAGNDENSGGGGGGNGGAGGFGGDSWSANISDGGEGGASFPATVNRVVMGGGGGGGSRNNDNGDTQASSGSAGGGIIIIRAYALSGTATLTANGLSAYNNTANDGGGGAGAGGSIVVLSANGGESGLTLQANGGVGGDAWGSEAFTLGNRHGPGGGGGGGVVIVSGTPASAQVNGAVNGTTETPGVPYGATAGANGFSVTNATITQTSGTQSGADCTPDMTILKSSSGVFTRGTSTNYTLTASNISPYGPTSATVTVNDTLPLGLTPISANGTGWACSIASQTVSCTDTTVLAGATSYPAITVGASVLQTAPATETNTGVVGGGGEINLTNDTSTNVASVVSSADLAVTNVASPNPVTAGTNLTFTQVLTNNGPSSADNVTLVQAVPANTTFVSITAPSGWSCTTPPVGGTGNVVCTALTMSSGTAGFSMVVKVNTGVANGTVITDTATASSSVTDPITTNNTASASAVVGASSTAEMTVTNVASPNPVVAGTDITYTQIATNIGTGTANNPSVIETVPANTTFASITVPGATTCTPTLAVGAAAGSTTTCSYPAAPAGASGTITFVVLVNPTATAGTVITDTVTANSTNQAFGANSAIATDVVAANNTQADLALSTAATPLTVYPGNDITYIQTVTNNGPATASNLSFTEAVPTNTTFASISIPAGWACTTPAVGATGNINCTASSLASGSSANILIVVNLAPTITAASISATSTITSSTTDPNSTNNSTSVTTPVLPVCDLSVTNAVNPTYGTDGQDLVYTQIVANSGPSNCASATFTEAIPTNTTLVLPFTSPAGWTCTTTGSISCTNPTIAPGASSTFTVTVQVGASVPAGTQITDEAIVGTTTHDSNTVNNYATVVVGVAGGTQADLSVTTSASPNPVAAGSNITYTQTATNAGPAAASTVTFTETLPANTTAVSLSTSSPGWTCTLATLTCTSPSFAATSTANFSFVVTVNAGTASGTTVTQTDSINSSVTGDPNSGNNSASTTVYVSPSADLQLTNAATPVPVQPNSTITYSQSVKNAGPSTATGVSLSETTPTGTTFNSITPAAGWSCTTPASGGTGTISCTDASLATGTANFSIVLNVPTGTAAGTVINNTATVTSSTADPNLTNNTATATDVVALSTQADLVTTNSASPTSVAPGSNVTYTQSVTNNGPATATTVSLTESLPANTTAVSLTTSSPGWTCTLATLTCTNTSFAASPTAANFTFVLTVNASTASGTSIPQTNTATASNIVPNLTTNSATAIVTVANAGTANVTIAKSATPNGSVPSGDTLTYTLLVTNTGPSPASGVDVTDPLPSDVTWLQETTTQGTCSQSGGTVTCMLGTMANGATATVTILTLAGAPGVAVNTASVTDDQMMGSTNTSTQTETITFATSVKLQSFTAHVVKDKSGVEHAVLVWKTGGEAHNLGFNVYREQNGERIQLNSSLIAGSALLMSSALPKHSGKTYAWIDSTPGAPSSQYWLEDVETSSLRTLHGPISPSSNTNADEVLPAVSATLNHLTQTTVPSATETSHRLENTQRNCPTLAQHEKQFEIASHPAVKIFARHEGWYRITQPDLIAAGLNPNVDPAQLHLYSEAIEQPIEITGATSGTGGFGPQAAISFYGRGIDTQYTGTRVYFLTTESTPGQRMQILPPSTGSNVPPPSFNYTVELTPHTTYFSALTTSNGNNFFGPLISSTPTDETMQVSHLDPTSTVSAQLEVVLQGVILAVPHDVTVTLNGTSLGDITFTGQDKGKQQISIPPGVLLNGANTIELTSEDGEYDYSLLQSIHITYPHLYAAESDQLNFTGRSGDQLKISGFTQSTVGIFDITNPDQPIQLSAQIVANSGSQPGFSAEVQVPWSANTSAQHTLMAVAADRISSAATHANRPSQWHAAQTGADIVMVSAGAFANVLASIAQAHKAEGKSSAIIPVDELYDEFNFGEHSPIAIRDFLQTAVRAWHTTPKYLLLNGRASLDPRNYLGFGYLDLVPTKIIPTTSLVTASDGWFSDFKDTGVPTIATGRLPVSTEAEAQLVAGKIATYEGQSTNGPWTDQALMVADINDTENFSQDSLVVQAQLPKSMEVNEVFATTMGVPQAAAAIVADINSGQLLVNYAGHGSEDMWSGSDLFDNNGANALTNGTSLPVFLIMDCLNGFFQDVYEQPLAVTLMLAPNGGAVAVLASSGLNQATPQTILDKLVVQSAMNPPQLALGDAVVKAKTGITDTAVRETYNLLGDPAMQIKPPTAAPTN